MDKKALYAMLDGLVTTAANQHSIDEIEARTLLGLTLRKSQDAIVSAIAVPVLSVNVSA